ncbi:hypothetical protein [Pleomorphomonas carboxyditropha]|uniref:Uncharacterized protein n=1 Tax=Pleomorphomonas carboxyditropha TaxID=2023338 RepID=A0A2G9WWC1_9HYPH|nr:hypothetical protein [Pleomorphomonas carboxyditropha]PIO98602.1 hypothetical protein CJ014_14895 [Pleomorphomonas carboxyditropha]
MDEPRTLKAPWPIIEHKESFEVQDASGSITIAFVYFEDEPGRQRATHRLSRDEARRVASHIARIPEYIAATKDEVK